MYDRQKTKIIATLGDPERKKRNASGEIEVSTTYKNGLLDINQEPIDDLSIRGIVDLFFKHGVDVIRINLAHIPLEFLDEKFRNIKRAILTAEKKYDRRVGVLADLPGPKIRFNQSDWLLPKAVLRLSFDKTEEDVTPQFRDTEQKEQNDPPHQSLAQINLDKEAFSAASDEARSAVDLMLKAVAKKLEELKEHPEQEFLAFIGDNDCTLEVQKLEGRIIVCKVISVKNGDRVVGGSKGFTIRGIPKPIRAFTSQDKDKLSALFRLDFEDLDTKDQPHERILSHIGISFCQTRDDVREVLYHMIENCIKTRLQLAKGKLSDYLAKAPLLIAKIETEEGVKNLHEILDIADGAMIARGDLAVEIETVDVPPRSKQIINRCNLRGKPVIMATQMLESMKSTIECTRPEATDVFSAVVDNVDALLLSGETSSGKYPGHAIEKMRALAKNAEKYVDEAEKYVDEDEDLERDEDIQGAKNIKEDKDVEERASEGRLFMGDAQIQEHFRQLEQIKERVKRWRYRWIRIGTEYWELSINGKITDEEYRFVDELARLKNHRLKKQHSTDRITHAACLMSVDPAVKAIVAPTASGRTARMLSRFRPCAWILAQPNDEFSARKVTIDRGVMVISILPVKKDPEEEGVDLLIRESRRQFREKSEELIGKVPSAIFTCGTPVGEVGSTNLIQRWDAK